MVKLRKKSIKHQFVTTLRDLRMVRLFFLVIYVLKRPVKL